MKHKLLATLTLTVLAACGSPGSPPPGQPPPGAATSAVALGDSFLIPETKISHTPAVVFTRDGTKMLTATAEGVIVVFEVSSRKLLRRIKLSEEATNSISMDPSGKYAVWGLAKGGIAVIEIAGGKTIARDAKVTARCIDLSPDATVVAVSNGKELDLRAVQSLKLLRSLSRHEGDVSNLAWSADGKRLASTGEDGLVRIHEVSTGKIAYEARKAEPLYAVAFHPSGAFVAYGGKDKQVYQYDFATKKEEVISKNQPYFITCLGYSPDGESIAVGDESCDIWLYTLKNKELTFHNKHHNECWLNSVAWAPDNETFLFGCRPNALQGKPTLYEPLAWTEAARSKSVERNRAALLKAVEAQIAKASEGEQKKALEEYKKSLSMEGQVNLGPFAQGAMADFPGVDIQLATATTSGGGALTGAAFALAEESSPRAQTHDKLPPELQRLAKEHEELLKKEVELLKENYCVNQWKVKKK
jgi:hypothetical protein